MCPWFLVESTAPSPAIGMGYVDYDILDGDGGTIRSITRRFTMANVQIRADLDGDGSIGIDDTYLRALDIGAVILWRVAQRDTPYNPSCVVIGQTGQFKITVGDSVAIPDTNIVWSGEGVEYVVNSFEDINGFPVDMAENVMTTDSTGQEVSFGIIIPEYSLMRDRAHEIGHSCGLDDVLYTFSGYDKVPPNPPGPITGPLVQNHVPDDWTPYYSPAVTHAEAIRRTLMNGFRSNSASDECDIPLGPVMGYAPLDGSLQLRGVGESSLNRNPYSLGWDYFTP